MKRKKKVTYPESDSHPPMILRDVAPPYGGRPVDNGVTEGPMVRTQIYLSRAEHEFVLGEASRRSVPMAAVIREFIDEQMDIPDDAWANNPMLQLSDDEPVGPEDGALNHDHYVYGAPKRFVKKDGNWVEAAPLSGDHYDPGQNQG